MLEAICYLPSHPFQSVICLVIFINYVVSLQAVMTEKWAKDYPEIRFFCMHPGWVDTPAARRGLKEFYDQMKDKFRNAEEGADTVIWLAISNKPLQLKNGGYFQGRTS